MKNTTLISGGILTLTLSLSMFNAMPGLAADKPAKGDHGKTVVGKSIISTKEN